MNYELQSQRSPLQRIRMGMLLLELKLIMPYLSFFSTAFSISEVPVRIGTSVWVDCWGK
nr:hypothetical protein Q903MT_gene648 [Picea sitchensis]